MRPFVQSMFLYLKHLTVFLLVARLSHGFVVPKSRRLTLLGRHQAATEEQPDKEDFWSQQQEILNAMKDSVDKSLAKDEREKFAKRRAGLLGDTAYISFFIFCTLWSITDNPLVAFSYSLGALMGIAYTYGLGKYVETIGGTMEDAEVNPGSGVGQARFAFLILLFVVIGKFRSVGLQEVPTIAGFFTYQLASLSQGLKNYDD